MGDISRLSNAVEEHQLRETRRSDEVGYALESAAERCFKTQYHITTEGTHYVINDILNSGAQKRSIGGAHSSTSLEIVGQCVAEIGRALRALDARSIASASVDHASM